MRSVPKSIAIVRRAGVSAFLPFLAALACRLDGETVDPPAFSVPPLVRQMEIRSLARWGDEIVVETDRSGINYRNEIASRPWFWRLTPGTRALSRLDPGGGRRFLGFSAGPSDRFGVALNGRELELLAFDASSPAGRRLCVVGESSQPLRVWVATLGRFICVIGPDQVTVVADNKVVGELPLARVVGPDTDRLLWLPGSVRAVAATRQEIFLGLEVGEFGGGAYAFSLTDSGRLHAARKVWSEHVSAIAAQGDDVVWMAGGGGGMGSISGSLVREHAGQLDVIVHQAIMIGRESPVASHPILRLPQATTMDGLALDADNRVIVAATQLGLISYRSGDGLKILWPKPLIPAQADPNHAYEGQPVSLVLHGDSLFLATRFLGVLEFARTPSGFEFRGQITIPTD